MHSASHDLLSCISDGNEEVDAPVPQLQVDSKLANAGEKREAESLVELVDGEVLVGWTAPNDRQNLMNWSPTRKLMIILVMAGITGVP